MQTILGAGGAIGKALAHELKHYTNKVRLVSRTPEKVNEDDELITADLMNGAAIAKAVKGSDVVYLTAGLPYKLKVWKKQWPVIIHNVMNACKQHHAKLVFFDNIYMYDANSLDNITENASVNPPSEKGKVREQIAQMILDEVEAGRLTAMIARAADFYGPGVNTSVIMELVYKNFKKGKKANWLADLSKIHSMTYVPDAAKATALLGNTPDAYNQIWHLPTSTERLTGNDWVNLFAQEMNVPPKCKVYSYGFIKFIGLVVPIMKEMHEMLYQYDRDYFFNSSRFQQRFPEFKTTAYKDGVREVAQYGKKKK